MFQSGSVDSPQNKWPFSHDPKKTEKIRVSDASPLLLFSFLLFAGLLLADMVKIHTSWGHESMVAPKVPWGLKEWWFDGVVIKFTWGLMP